LLGNRESSEKDEAKRGGYYNNNSHSHEHNSSLIVSNTVTLEGHPCNALMQIFSVHVIRSLMGKLS